MLDDIAIFRRGPYTILDTANSVGALFMEKEDLVELIHRLEEVLDGYEEE